MWISLDVDLLRSIEKRADSYSNMGVELLDLVYQSELKEPNNYCCTKSKGKELLDQTKLNGIRCKESYVIVM